MLSWLRLIRVFQKVDRRLQDRCRDHGITGAQVDVIARVHASQGITQQELADALLVTKGNVCQLLDRMERGGLLERRQEGRTNRVFLTNRGCALYDDVVPGGPEAVSCLFDALTIDEQSQLLHLLRKLDRSLE